MPLTATIIEILGKIVPEPDLDPLSLQQDLRATLGIIFYDFLNFIIGSSESLGVNIPESDYGKLQSLADMLNYLSERVDKTVLFPEFLFRSKALCLPCFPFYETLLSKNYFLSSL